MPKSKPPIPRPWSRALLWAAAITLFIVLATAVINPLFDRVVNWGLLTIFAIADLHSPRLGLPSALDLASHPPFIPHPSFRPQGAGIHPAELGRVPP